MANKGYSGANEGTKGETGERMPKGAKSSDSGGERKVGMKNGVAMGKADMKGADETGDGRRGFGQRPDRGEYNTGRSESVCYEHKRLKHSSGSN